MPELFSRMKQTFTIDKDLYAQLKMLSKTTRVPLSRLLDEAVELLLKKYDK